MYLWGHFLRERNLLKTTDAHRRKFILPSVTQSHPALPKWGNDTLTLTFIMTSQWKIVKYPDNSKTLRAEDLKALADDRSRTSLSTPLTGRLLFGFRLTRRVALRDVELFIGQVMRVTALIKMSLIQ